MKLKIKAKIYQYTGLYLANKESKEYLMSKEFWEEYNRMLPHNIDNDFTDTDLQGLLLGSWECDNGFYRSYPSVIFSPWYLKPFYWCFDFYRQLKSDLT